MHLAAVLWEMRDLVVECRSGMRRQHQLCLQYAEKLSTFDHN